MVVGRSKTDLAGLMVLAVVALVLVWRWGVDSGHEEEPKRGLEAVCQAGSPARYGDLHQRNAALAGHPTAPEPASALSPAFQTGGVLRPLPVAFETEHFAWAAGDCMDTNVIRQLAHNELEYARMVEENGRILDRWLVYRKERIDALMQRLRMQGLRPTVLVLPGVPGRELVMEVHEMDIHPSGFEGGFAGRLVGRPDSFVTLAFLGGRESFTVISPSEGLYLQGDPREPGEIILKRIDPERYIPGMCGTPDAIEQQRP